MRDWRKRRRCSIGYMIVGLLLWRGMRRLLRRGRVIKVGTSLHAGLGRKEGIADVVADYYLHEHILALWGCPLGEMLDLEKLSRRCKEQNRWTFFVTSAPANCPGMFRYF